MRVLIGSGFFAFAGLALAGINDITIPCPPDAYQVAYASNINVGDSYVNITNAGTRGGYDASQTGFGPTGGICANVYVFDPSEEMVSCCSCYVSPDGLRSLSVQNDLVSKTLTPSKPNGVVIKLVATAGDSSSTCDPAGFSVYTKVIQPAGWSSPRDVGSGRFDAESSPLGLEGGMRAWLTTLHLNTATGASALTENAFQQALLSLSELQKLTTFCAFIKANGSSYGICNSCRLGGTLGGDVR